MKNKEATYDDDEVPEAEERSTPYICRSDCVD